MASAPRLPLALASALLGLVLTACATPYAARGAQGGYSDTRIDDSHYLVTFNGNASTSKDRVYNFWLHRCAELTAQQGFAYFDIQPAKDRAGLDGHGGLGHPRLAIRPPASSSGLAMPARYTYFYVPPTTVTTWSSKAVVAMYRTVPARTSLLSAQRVLELLGPYVKSDGAEKPPERKAIYRGAAVKLGATGEVERVFPEGQVIGFVDNHRLLESVPEGKAARQRIKARFDALQAQIDARVADIKKLQATHDAETDAGRRATLASELSAKKGAVKAFFDQSQAEIDAEEKKALGQLTERIAPLVEQVRVTRKLDSVTDQGTAGFWDADVTGDVIKAYLEKYPAPSAT